MPSRSSIFKKWVFWADPDKDSQTAAKDLLLRAGEDVWWYAKRCAKVYLANPAEAPALLEQALLVVYRSLKKAEKLPSKDEVSAYLRNQMRRVAKQEVNRRRLEEYAGNAYDLDELLSPSQISDIDDQILWSQFMAALPAASRTVAQLRLDGRSWGEIAAALGLHKTNMRLSFRRDAEQAIRELQIKFPARRRE